jgi:hypothetical protein
MRKPSSTRKCFAASRAAWRALGQFAADGIARRNHARIRLGGVARSSRREEVHDVKDVKQHGTGENRENRIWMQLLRGEMLLAKSLFDWGRPWESILSTRF